MDFLIDFFDLLIDIKVIFFHQLIKKRSNLIKFNQKLVDLNPILKLSFNRNLISSLNYESSLNCYPNLDGLKSKSLTIRFQTRNCLSLGPLHTMHFLKRFSGFHVFRFSRFQVFTFSGFHINVYCLPWL